MDRPDQDKSRPAKRPEPASREERLAAALRENLRKRKAQARARDVAPPPVKPPAAGG